MKKKHRVVFGIAVLLTAALCIFAGCNNPSGGDDDPGGPEPEPFTDPHGIVMTQIPAGTFMMGSPVMRLTGVPTRPSMR